MKIFLAFLRVCAYSAAIAAAFQPSVLADDWTLPRQNSQLTNSTTEDLALPLSLAWQHTASPFPGNNSQPIAVGSTVIFSSGDRITAIETTNGSRKWTWPSDSPLGSQIKTSLAYDRGKVFFGANDGNLYCISARDGRYLWAYATQSPIRSSPMVVDGNVYFGSDDDALHCVDADNGEPKWPGGFRTRDDVNSTPAVAGGLVYFLSRDTHLYAALAQTGRARWSFRLPVPAINSEPVIGQDVVYLAADNMLYALAARSGVRKWVISLPAEISASPALADQVLYVPLRNHKLYAIDAKGKPKWAEPADTVHTPRASPIVAGRTIITVADRGVVSAFDTETGILKWRYVLYPLSAQGKTVSVNDIVASAVYANGTLYVLPADGTLSAFRVNAPDNEAPVAYYLTPAPGSVTNGSPPLKMLALVYDNGSGIDEGSISLALDGTAVEHTYDAATGVVSYVTPYAETQIPLSNGRHELVLTAKDWKGNELKEAWSFVVDNSLPKPKVRAPAPATPRQPRVRNSGRNDNVQPQPQPGPTQPPGGREAPPMPPPPPGGPGGPSF